MTPDRTPDACVLSMAGCEGFAATFVEDELELIACCDSCERAWQWRRQRKAEADSAHSAETEVIDLLVDKLDGK